MPRKARIHFVSLRSSLVNLPISIYGPLLERSIRPQNLAIHLTLAPESRRNADTKLEAYVGWTGMASASSLAQFNSSNSGEMGIETIEIDPQYAQGLGFNQGDVVEIGLLHDLPTAKSVATEPLTSDDWEIIEIHASHVESTLLSQVRVAKVGQEINVWVLGRTRVRLRVVSLDPQSKNDALLLVTDTEVSIAPKLHRTQNPSSKGSISKSNTSTSQKSPPSTVVHGSTSTSNNGLILRALPQRVLTFSLPKYSGPEVLSYLSPTTFYELFPSRKGMDTKNTVYIRSTARRLLPPVDPSLPPSSNPTTTPVPRILNPSNNNKGEASGEDGPRTAGDVLVGCIEGIPEKHLVFTVPLGDIEDWDILRLSPVPNSSAIHLNTEAGDTTEVVLRTPSKSPLAGIDVILTRCVNFCVQQFIVHASTNVIHGVSSLLIAGRSGTGKTSIARAVAKTIEEDTRTLTYTHFIDLSRYSEQPISALKALFQFWFDKAAWHRPSILVLDNLDKLLSVELEHADSFRARHITEIFISIYSSSARAATANSRGIILLATASSTTALHPLVNATHIFQEIVNVQPPNKDARRDIIASIIKERLEGARDIQEDTESPLNYTAIATQTEGYSAMDLHDLVGRAVHQVAVRASTNKPPILLTSTDFAAAQADFVPLSLRDVKLQKSEVAWSDIGGLHETRRILRETIEWPTKYGPIFAQSPLRLRSGLLLYGFPGCGKTLLASAVAKECGLNFISVKGPEILNKYIGASEKSVRDLFERASAAKPCVLFFDEFDSIAPKRGHDSTGVTDRVVNQMLTQMDGAEGLDGVYVLAATSRPDLIDSALLRPGRLDKSLLCGMPNLEERKDILRAVAQKVFLSSSVNIDEVAAATDGYSGADLQALVYNAHLEVVHASISHASDDQIATPEEESTVEYTSLGGPRKKGITTKAEEMALQKRLHQIRSVSQMKRASVPPASALTNRVITEEHIRRVLKNMRPSVSPEERGRLSRIYRDFISDRSGELPVPPDAGGVGQRVSLM